MNPGHARERLLLLVILFVAGLLRVGWPTLTEFTFSEARLEALALALSQLFLLSRLLVPVLVNLCHSLDLYPHFFLLVVPASCLIIGGAAQAALDGLSTSGITVAAPQGVGPSTSRAKPSLYRIRTSFMLGCVSLLLPLSVAQVTSLVVMGRLVASENTAGGFGAPLRRHLAPADRAVEAVRETDATEALVVGLGDSPVADEMPAFLDDLLRGRVASRFADARISSLFPQQRAVALLRADAGAASGWYGTSARPTAVLPDGSRRVHLDGSWRGDEFKRTDCPRVFQNGVELQGTVWHGDATPGGRGRLWLLWQILWHSPTNTHFFVQVTDEEGRLLAKQDEAGYPSQYRKSGERLDSTVDITLPWGAPPAGRQRSQSGLSLYPGVISVPVIGAAAGKPLADRVDLGYLSAPACGSAVMGTIAAKRAV